MVGSVAGLRASEPLACPVREPALDCSAVGVAMCSDRVERVAERGAGQECEQEVGHQAASFGKSEP